MSVCSISPADKERGRALLEVVRGGAAAAEVAPFLARLLMRAHGELQPVAEASAKTLRRRGDVRGVRAVKGLALALGEAVERVAQLETAPDGAADAILTTFAAMGSPLE